MSPRESTRDPEDYEVSISSRLFDLLGIDPIMLGPGDDLEYSWHGGYETLKVRHQGEGSLEYAGAYHPGDGSCVGGGVCIYCGRTLHV